MEQIKNKSFGGERPLFGAHDVRLEDITITDGESGIKCCKNIECPFQVLWQIPLVACGWLPHHRLLLRTREPFGHLV